MIWIGEENSLTSPNNPKAKEVQELREFWRITI